MNNQIPRSIISLLSNKMPELETHATLDSMFLHADVLGEPPKASEMSKTLKVQEWLLRINKLSQQPLSVLGRVIEKYMVLPEVGSVSPYNISAVHQLIKLREWRELRESLIKQLETYGLSYINGELIAQGGSLPRKDLSTLIHEKNIPAISLEFEKALKNVNAEPLDAVSASSNLLESICKGHIEDGNLNMPQKQDLRSLWRVVSEDLGFDPSKLQDEDLKRIVSGMFSIIDGISALRTDGSSAHGQGTTLYRPAPRHARFAVNSAHSLALFLLETSISDKT